jgi:xanthine dehydrogenase YagS FAD-binding subunit
MKSFNHVNAKTVDEAVKTLKRYRGKAKLIAGGTDLIGALKHRILPDWPEAIINIKTIHGLNTIKEDTEGLKVGALTKLSDIAESGTVRQKYKLLAEAAEAVATPQIRNMASIGGNLCQDIRCWYYRYPHNIGGRLICRRKGGKTCYAIEGDNRYHSIFGASNGCVAVNPSDIAVALLALEAKIKIASPMGTRIIPIEDFFNSLRNVLKSDEMVTEVQVPCPSDRARQTFLKFRSRQAIDFASASVASVITVNDGTCEEARIALGAVAPRPFRATASENKIKGKVVNDATAEAAAGAAVVDAIPLNKNAYKVGIIKELVKRALLS